MRGIGMLGCRAGFYVTHIPSLGLTASNTCVHNVHERTRRGFTLPVRVCVFPAAPFSCVPFHVRSHTPRAIFRTTNTNLAAGGGVGTRPRGGHGARRPCAVRRVRSSNASMVP